MSSNPIDAPLRPSAEAEYRAAFERLKSGKTARLPKGSAVSQNNVAKEAGCDPSALKKSRFPTLVADIQAYVAAHAGERPTSPRATLLAQRQRNRNLRKRLEEIVGQRDAVTSLLDAANTKMLELTEHVAQLEARLASNVIAMKK